MNTCLILVGPLYTDIVATGLKQFPTSGGYVYGDSLSFSAGGKACNIAQMAAKLLPPDTVAMLGRTIRDQHGLWEIPIKALQKAGVNTDAIVVDEASTKLPNMTLVMVDSAGNNQVVVLPGGSDDFSKANLDNAASLFSEVANNNGFVGLTLESPIEVVKYAAETAKNHGIRIVLDPGGIQDNADISPLLNGVFLIKPNEHEAKAITGVTVENLESAHRAAEILMSMGAINVLITVGADGAYLFTQDTQNHIHIPTVHTAGSRDETGCGDQVMATLCAYLQRGYSVEDSAKIAITTGTLQFCKQGIQPITKEELEKAANS